MKIVEMTVQQVRELPEYSSTLPTGTTIGKQWKRHEPYRRPDTCQSDGKCGHWFLGEYVPVNMKGHVGIDWKQIVVVDVVKPPPPPAVRRAPSAWRPEED